MKPVDHDHPFYKPLWRRRAIVGVTAVWAILELLYARDALWVTIATGVWAYCFWTFLIKWKDGA